MAILRMLFLLTGALSWAIVGVAVLFMAYGECRGLFRDKDMDA